MGFEAGGDGIQAARQRTQQRQQLLARQLLFVCLEEIDKLAILRKFCKGVAVEQFLSVGAAGDLGEVFNQRFRQRGDVETFLNFE